MPQHPFLPALLALGTEPRLPDQADPGGRCGAPDCLSNRVLAACLPRWVNRLYNLSHAEIARPP